MNHNLTPFQKSPARIREKNIKEVISNPKKFKNISRTSQEHLKNTSRTPQEHQNSQLISVSVMKF
jgi:hypothetical protein